MKSIALSFAVMGLLTSQLFAQETQTKAKPWFDMESCTFCKHFAEHEGLMASIKFEFHKTDNGMIMVCHVPEGMKDALNEADKAMKAVAEQLATGANLPMCGFCEAYGQLMAKGAKIQEFKGDIVNIAIMTSDKPELVNQIHAMADRSIQEMKVIHNQLGTQTRNPAAPKKSAAGGNETIK